MTRRRRARPAGARPVSGPGRRRSPRPARPVRSPRGVSTWQSTRTGRAARCPVNRRDQAQSDGGPEPPDPGRWQPMPSAIPVASSKPTLPVGPHSMPVSSNTWRTAVSARITGRSRGRGRRRRGAPAPPPHHENAGHHPRVTLGPFRPRSPTATWSVPAEARPVTTTHGTARRASQAPGWRIGRHRSAAAAGSLSRSWARGAATDSIAASISSRTDLDACRVVTAAAESSRLDRSRGPPRARRTASAMAG